MNITVEMQEVVCGRCAISYAVPISLFEIRKADGRPMRCPGCGWRNWINEPHPADIERRREEVRRIHEREQAEARMADAMMKALATCPQLREDRPESPASDPEPLKCPKCGKVYKMPGCYGRHLRRVHKIEPATTHPAA